MTTRVLTSRTRQQSALNGLATSLAKWLGHALYQNTTPTRTADNEAPWWADISGQVHVALDVVRYATPTSYVVAGTWPTPDDAAYLRVTSAPASALAARVDTVWIVRNETASTVTVAGVSVLTKTIVWICTDSLGATTSLSMGAVP